MLRLTSGSVGSRFGGFGGGARSLLRRADGVLSKELKTVRASEIALSSFTFGVVQGRFASKGGLTAFGIPVDSLGRRGIPHPRPVRVRKALRSPPARLRRRRFGVLFHDDGLQGGRKVGADRLHHEGYVGHVGRVESGSLRRRDPRGQRTGFVGSGRIVRQGPVPSCN